MLPKNLIVKKIKFQTVDVKDSNKIKLSYHCLLVMCIDFNAIGSGASESNWKLYRNPTAFKCLHVQLPLI